MLIIVDIKANFKLSYSLQPMIKKIYTNCMNIRSEDRTSENLQVLKTILETARKWMKILNIILKLKKEEDSLYFEKERFDKIMKIFVEILTSLPQNVPYEKPFGEEHDHIFIYLNFARPLQV
jgi:hypothetical protein